jgi:2-phospho-L-lactate transferase/gluconeogenesis factor (CofD/UPF0052 family)
MSRPRLKSTARHDQTQVTVVLFTGGRGSRVLSKRLINNPRIDLTLAINGYDDGASTGAVRAFLGDCLGPSDFRKNASWLARELNCCQGALIDLLDYRFPEGISSDQAMRVLQCLVSDRSDPGDAIGDDLWDHFQAVETHRRRDVALSLARFQAELRSSSKSFSFSDCSLGNLVFAGCFLSHGRRFNEACQGYFGLLNLPEGLIENVTAGADAYLVALDREGRLLASEAEIVDVNRRNYIDEIFLIDRPFSPEDHHRLSGAPVDLVRRMVEDRAVSPAPNERLLDRIAAADLIIYAPGTQYSSLFPSYMTSQLGAAIARNLTAVKLLITNLREDAESPDCNATDIIEKAVYYLSEKGRSKCPTPALITHYVINDPGDKTRERPYVPLGRIEHFEDPRLVRIGNYEEGISGRHDASSVLTPFIESFLRPPHRPKVDVLLLETDSHNKIAQTILEMLRGGICDVPVDIEVFYSSGESLSQTFTDELPFRVNNLSLQGDADQNPAGYGLCGQPSDYVLMFESSGMYKGEDIVNLVSLLTHERLDAIWGSRRLSVKDISESYRLRYRRNVLLGVVSFVGSHMLTLAYLLLYGRYFSDTLSGLKIVKSSCLRVGQIDLRHKYVNQHVLSLLSHMRAEVLEAPVQYFPISPEKIRRTTIAEGLCALATVVRWRFKSLRTNEVAGSRQVEVAGRRSASGTATEQDDPHFGRAQV